LTDAAESDYQFGSDAIPYSSKTRPKPEPFEVPFWLIANLVKITQMKKSLRD
jgi:hypothetical protein